MECFEGVDSFKYLGRILHHTYEDWPAVCRKIWRARQVWGRLEKLLRREGADSIISEKFYRAVVQVVLLFGLETWALTAAMLKARGGTCGFPAASDGDEGSKSRGRELEKGGVG